MPQPTQNSLIHVLLMWIAILSIVQVVFIVLFFTAGHHGMSQNSSAVAPERPMQFQKNNTPSESPSDHGLILGKGKMLIFKATKVNGKMKWRAKNRNQGLVSEEDGGKVLKMKGDGYFFLHLQLTLFSCNATWGLEQTVSLKKLQDDKVEDKVILQGWFNTKTCSTGFLGKVEELHAGSTLEVIVNLPTTEYSINESLTYLGIIYIYEPR
ncbi:uncharacterized protein LOC129098889 [Anoplopoma fimbria]|uniref:uncharacterized protein LOC129098889 n=1 Tax=Anoplopoma fimbria TaxID=229290 RepID=UPI0023EC895A|nr:uncharacterized protein LOC129098889 [Anoplopoma fimbria]